MRIELPSGFGYRQGLIAALLLLSAVVVGIGYPMWWKSPPVTTADTNGYQRVAQDFQEHGSLTQLHFRAPGYPILLLLTGSCHSLQRSLFFVMLALHFVTIGMLLAILEGLKLPSWALIFSCLVCLSPPFVEPTIYYHTEIPTAFLLVGSLWLITAKIRSWLSGTLAGSLIGLSALTRPSYQLLALPLFIFLLFNRQAKKSLFLLFSSSLIVSGFALFNLWTFGYFGVTPALGWNLSTKTFTFVERIPEKETREILLEHRDAALVRGGADDAMMYIWRVDKSELFRATGLTGVDLDRYMTKLNVQLILASPLNYLAEVGNSLVRYWFPASGTFASNNSRWLQLLWTIVHFALVAAFFAALVAVFGTAMTQGRGALCRELGTVYMLGLIFIFYTMIVSCSVDTGNPRYRVPTDSILLVTTVVGMCIWQRLRVKRGSELAHTK